MKKKMANDDFERYEFHIDDLFSKKLYWELEVYQYHYSEKNKKMKKGEAVEAIQNFYDKVILPALKRDLIDLLKLAKGERECR